MVIPFDSEVESTLAGICLSGGVDAVEEIQLSGGSRLFYDDKLREVWNRCEKLMAHGKPVQLITVAKEKVEHEIELQFLSNLETQYGLPASFARQYLPQAVDFQKRRDALAVCVSLAGDIKDKNKPADESIDLAESVLFEARSNIKRDCDLAETVLLSVADWEKAHENQGVYSGVESGFTDLDRLTWGFQPADLIIVAARPSQGKTALLCNIAEYCAVHRKIPTLFFSIEMTAKSIVKRIICSYAGLDSSRLRSGQLVESDFPKMTNAAGKVKSAPLHILDRSSITGTQIRSTIRRFVRKFGVKLVLVDYLQKIRSSGRHEKRTYEVGEASTALKEAAKESNVPIVCAAQLNREPEKEKSRPPRLSDLGDSGMIERDADLVASLYVLPESEQKDRNFVRYHLLLQKHREGETGRVRLLYDRKTTKFKPSTNEDHD